MQDLNNLQFDSDQISTIDQLKTNADLETSLKNLGLNIKDGSLDLGEKNSSIDKSPKTSVKEDIKNQKAFEKNKLKANIFNTLFENEQQLYFDEHKHIMPSKEKKRLKAILIKKISNGDIYMNEVGKLIIRKGKNK